MAEKRSAAAKALDMLTGGHREHSKHAQITIADGFAIAIGEAEGHGTIIGISPIVDGNDWDMAGLKPDDARALGVALLLAVREATGEGDTLCDCPSCVANDAVSIGEPIEMNL